MRTHAFQGNLSHPRVIIVSMESGLLDQAVELLEKANAELQPQLLTHPHARDMLATYAKIEKLAGFGVATLTRKVEDVAEVARVTGTSIGKAKAAVATGKVMDQSDDLSLALQQGAISRDQAAEIATAVESAPDAAKGLLEVAETESFQVLREKSRKAKLEAEQHKGLFARQHAAPSGRSYRTISGWSTSMQFSSPMSALRS